MIAVINYNAGNVRSVLNALSRLGAEAVLTADHSVIRQADKVIFPGVGEASTTMHHLKEKGLQELIPSLTQPFLGVCLGLQLMCKHSEEGNTDCLGLFDIEVKKFPPQRKVPHMGWNSTRHDGSGVFLDLPDAPDFYFVHSYYAEVSPYTIAQTDYILPFSAAIAKDNFSAVQFHPEKSASAGEQILKNFLAI